MIHDGKVSPAAHLRREKFPCITQALLRPTASFATKEGELTFFPSIPFLCVFVSLLPQQFRIFS